MTTDEIRALVAQKIAGQGSAVDVGGALPTIINALCDALDAIPAPIPQVQSDWAQDDSAEVDYIKNKPAIAPRRAVFEWDGEEINDLTFAQAGDSLKINGQPITQELFNRAIADCNAIIVFRDKKLASVGSAANGFIIFGGLALANGIEWDSGNTVVIRYESDDTITLVNGEI